MKHLSIEVIKGLIIGRLESKYTEDNMPQIAMDAANNMINLAKEDHEYLDELIDEKAVFDQYSREIIFIADRIIFELDL